MVDRFSKYIKRRLAEHKTYKNNGVYVVDSVGCSSSSWEIRRLRNMSNPEDVGKYGANRG